MRARSWLAVSLGTLTGSALAITGSPQSRAAPAATTAHRRTIWIFTKILASRLLTGQDGSDDPFRPDIQQRYDNRGLAGGGSRRHISGPCLSSGDLLPV